MNRQGDFLEEETSNTSFEVVKSFRSAQQVLDKTKQLRNSFIPTKLQMDLMHTKFIPNLAILLFTYLPTNIRPFLIEHTEEELCAIKGELEYAFEQYCFAIHPDGISDFEMACYLLYYAGIEVNPSWDKENIVYAAALFLESENLD